jgi:hypothetical protein
MDRIQIVAGLIGILFNTYLCRMSFHISLGAWRSPEAPESWQHFFRPESAGSTLRPAMKWFFPILCGGAAFGVLKSVAFIIAAVSDHGGA